jgi:hypothetical protein
VIVVTGDDDHLGRGRESGRQHAQNRLRAVQGLAQRAVAQLDHIAQQDQAVDLVQGGREPFLRILSRQDLPSPAGTQVQV